MMENNRREREISNASFIEFQKRIDLLEYKTFTVEKDMKQALDFKAIQSYSPGSGQGQLVPSSSDSNGGIGKNEYNMLRQAMAQER